jgi:hypothetical protein
VAAIATDKALVNNTNWSVGKVLVTPGKRFRNETLRDIVLIDVCYLRQAIALPPRENELPRSRAARYQNELLAY